MTGSALPRICVIGAGPSGLATLKNLRQAGLTNLVCYEASDTIGGNWAYKEEEGHSSVYASTPDFLEKAVAVRGLADAGLLSGFLLAHAGPVIL
jgi:cation diffusion facilitator CzcD-associated flavoprotein CzcO